MTQVDFSSSATSIDGGETVRVLQAQSGELLTVPGESWLLKADFSPQGPDLLLTGPGGNQVLIRDFFNLETPPDLVTDAGGVIPAELAVKLAGPAAPGQFALLENGPFAELAQGVESIGRVEATDGIVEAVRADGTTVTLSKGDDIFQGDTLVTAKGAAIGITFVDDTTFSLGEEGRMVIDEMVYDPETHEGAFSANLVQGVFTFVSGEVAKTSPDAMTLTTPVATIGIRGTKVAGRAAQEGADNTISLLPETDAQGVQSVGELSVTNQGGTVTLSSIGATVQMTSAFAPPPPPVVFTPQQIQQNFGSTLTMQSETVAAKATNEAQENAQAAEQAQAEADQAGAEAETAEADAAAAEAEAETKAAEAEAARAAAEEAGDEEALAAAEAAEAEAEVAAAEAEAKAAEAEAQTAEAEAKAAEAETAVAEAETAEAEATAAVAQANAQAEAFAQFGAPPPEGPASGEPLAGGDGPPDGEAPPDGEPQPADGEAPQEGEASPGGEGEPLPEGEGEQLAEGEALGPEGEGPGPVDAAIDAAAQEAAQEALADGATMEEAAAAEFEAAREQATADGAGVEELAAAEGAFNDALAGGATPEEAMQAAGEAAREVIGAPNALGGFAEGPAGDPNAPGVLAEGPVADPNALGGFAEGPVGDPNAPGSFAGDPNAAGGFAGDPNAPGGFAGAPNAPDGPTTAGGLGVPGGFNAGPAAAGGFGAPGGFAPGPTTAGVFGAPGGFDGGLAATGGFGAPGGFVAGPAMTAMFGAPGGFDGGLGAAGVFGAPVSLGGAVVLPGSFDDGNPGDFLAGFEATSLTTMPVYIPITTNSLFEPDAFVVTYEPPPPPPPSDITSVVDGTAPTASATTATISTTGSATVQSTETGTAYLVNSSASVTTVASIKALADNQWNSTPITLSSIDTSLSASGLSSGTYKVYTEDAAGNISAASVNSVTVNAGPTFTGMTATDSAYGVGENLDITVSYSANVTVNTSGGTPTLSLSNGARATYQSGSGSSDLVFRYTVAEGNPASSDLSVTAFNLNSGTIQSSTGIDAQSTASSAFDLGSVTVDGDAPDVSAVATTASSGTYVNDNIIPITVAYDEAVTVNTSGGTPSLSLSNGGSATYASGSGSNTLTFNYTVSGGNSFDTSSLSVSSLNLNSGTITDAAGASVSTSVTSSAFSGITVNATVVSPSTLALSSLDGTTGFRLDGAGAGDWSGWAVSSAGDVNGDGYGDVIVGSVFADPNGGNSGSSYVVFGKASGFSSTINLSSLDGTTGFRLDGVTADDRSGISIDSAGDVNADGYDDVIIGAPRANPNGGDSGSSYVVYGKASGFSSTINLSGLDGTTGFRLDGVSGSDNAGTVSNAGDVNGDGFDDVIIGAVNADDNGSNSGSSYVVFGKASGFGATTNLSSLDGSSGFRLDGATAGDKSGWTVGGVGDVNGDGYGDVLVGAWQADPNGTSSGSAYIVFGKAAGFSATTNLSSLNGTTGFRVDGVGAMDRLSYNTISRVGDVNGDGYDDIVISAKSADPNNITDAGSAYVVFGKASGFSSTFDLSSLDGTTGFRLDGVATSDTTSVSVGGAGDFNGDGYDDLIISAPNTDPNGDSSGGAYVVFGKASGFSATTTLSSLDGSSGFRLDGVAASDTTGFSAHSAGDVNGDGFDDLIIGAHKADNNSKADSGSSYVVFGKDYTGKTATTGTTGNDSYTGTSAANIIIGGLGDDTLVGGGGADVIRGGGGNDNITVSASNFQQVDGGSGTDVLSLAAALDLTTTSKDILGIEAIDLSHASANSLTLNALNLLDMTDGSNALVSNANSLVIAGDTNDSVIMSGGTWTKGSDSSITVNGTSDTYAVYTNANDDANLYIDTNIALTISM